MDMKNSEGQPRGGQRFGMATAPLHPVREKELAPPPTPEEVKAANAGKSLSKTENAILGFAKKHPVITVGSTLAAIAGGFAAVEAYQGNIPGIHRSVDQGSSFDNGATEQKITDKNSSNVTLEQFKNMDIKSTYSPENQTFTYVLPFAVPDGVQIDYKKISSPTSGPDTPLYHEEIGLIGKDGKPAAGVGVMVNDDGWHVRLSQGWEDSGEDPNSVRNVSLFRYFPEQDITAWIFITDPSVSLKTIMPTVDTRKIKLKDYESELPSVSKGTIVATTTEGTVQNLIQLVQIYRGKNIKPDERQLVKNVDPNLLTDISKVLIVNNK